MKKFCLIFLSFLVLSSCTDEWRRKKETQVWSSSNPAEIPYKLRLKQFQKGNLVKNHSFEVGKIITARDSSKKQSIAHWEIIGDSVTYYEYGIDTLSTLPVADGKRAIKIVNQKANETDSLGEGVMSEFIEVLPGNYEFTAYLRLEKIKPQLERLGTRIFDAINIRLFFYDKQKKLINPGLYYPYLDIKLDNSFKGYSFSNYFYIDEFGWDKVICRTYNYPFIEGDLPDGTHYVRLFFGLKGRGTMYVDNVDFRYSKWNFTTKERMAWYKDSTFTPLQLLVPKPHFAKHVEDIKLSNYENIVILNDFNKSNLNTYTINQLLKTLSNENRNILVTNNAQSIKPNSIVFHLTSYNKIDTSKHSKIINGITKKEQSYIITDTTINNQKHIKIAANDEWGVFYGVTTIMRLYNKDNDTYTHAHIIDYPDFVGRGYQLSSWKTNEDIEFDIKNFEYLTFYRFNKAYLPYYQNDMKKWFDPPQIIFEGTKKMAEYVAKNKNIHLGIMFNPYYHFRYEMHTSQMSDSLKYIWIHNQKGMEMIKKILKPSFDQGATFLMLLADDFVPHSGDYRKIYTLWTPEDIKQHVNLQNAQAYMVNYLYDWLKSYGKIRFELCPPWYLNEFIDKSRGTAEQYFRDLNLQIPRDVEIIWTGNTVRSLSFDAADLKRYADLCGRQPMLWDNTLYARALEGIYAGYPAHYPERCYLANLFEPYDVKMPHNYFNSSPHIYTNGQPSTEIYKIKYATVADFEWNMNEYNPELSLWKTLLYQYGKEIAWELIEFNDSYFATLSVIAKLEQKKETYEKLKPEFDKNFKELKEKLDKLEKLLASKNEKLSIELKKHVERLEERSKKIDDEIRKSGNEQI